MAPKPIPTTQSAVRRERRSSVNGSHRFASIVEAADYLACEHKLVRKMITTGQLTRYRLPGSKLIRVDLNELDALLNAGRVVA